MSGMLILFAKVRNHVLAVAAVNFAACHPHQHLAPTAKPTCQTVVATRISMGMVLAYGQLAAEKVRMIFYSPHRPRTTHRHRGSPSRAGRIAEGNLRYLTLVAAVVVRVPSCRIVVFPQSLEVLRWMHAQLPVQWRLPLPIKFSTHHHELPTTRCLPQGH